MINTVQQALEDVYVALGGQEDIDRLTVSQVLAKIYNVLGGTGDHGDETVPQLIDLIATVAPSGGGGGGGTSFPKINADYSGEDTTYTCDMTWAEAYAVYEALARDHKIPFMQTANGDPDKWELGEYFDGEDFAGEIDGKTYVPAMSRDTTAGFFFTRYVFANDGVVHLTDMQ